MKVEADVDEADIGQVKEGQKVEFVVDAYINDVFYGVVHQIRLEPVTTNNVVTYTVIIEAPNPDSKLLPGMTANVTIVTEEHSGLAVPVEALNFMPSQEVMVAMGKPEMKHDMPKPGKMPKPGQGQMPPMPDGMPGQGQMPPLPGQMNDKIDMVWVMDNGVMAPRFIETDMSDGVYKIVNNGVTEGDSIVLSANFVSKKQDNNARPGSNPFMPGPPPGRNNNQKR